MDKIKIGSHVGISGGLLGAVKESISYGATAFMCYTGAPQNTVRSDLAKLKIPEGLALMKESEIEEFVVHAPYIINLATFKEENHKFSIDFLKSELDRTKKMGSNYLVVHPGSYTTSSLEEGTSQIIKALNEVLTEDTPIICLETMAGKGSEIGRNFDELKAIIDNVELKHKVGVCFDTCHTHDSGYDIINDFDNIMKEFDEKIGLDKLYVFHINGSLNPRGAKKDRHANISADESNPKGKDYIGVDAIKNIVHSPYTKGKIFILETPWISKTENLYKQEIEMLR